MPLSKKKIGILGGGQLARMLTLKAHEMGIEPHVLSPSKTDPSAQVTSFWTQGSLDSLSDLTRFFKKVDQVTFENEFINIDILNSALKKTKIKAMPSPAVLKTLQDKWLQKKLLKKHKIPLPDFIKIDSYSDLLDAFIYFNKKMVLKKRRFGYDGHGIFILKNFADCKKIKPLLTNKNQFVGEAFIPFQCELAVILAVHKKTQPIALPLVETFQKNFCCLWVKGPISKTQQTQKLISQLKSFVKAIQYEGVIAFEIFKSPKGLLVNELAPRVHNSGHYSLNALSQDQFTLHLSACLRQPLTTPKLLYPGFAMLNLLGKEESCTHWKKQKEVFLHVYGKQEKRKGRKMGHLNAGADSPQKALNKLLKIQKNFK